MAISSQWFQLPKFLLVDESRCLENDRVWVLHCYEPQFLLEFGPAGIGDLLLIDDCRDFQVLAKRKEQAREFYAGET